ncbi:SGNH/GDSL hydrolase family protein [Lewinella sp. W8]|uniref:SGNH/GDSL hydrolase family protein n=1 Tax=Lewinella sp. W8 TaxID=2528208 RepID=UPI00106748D4|nr:SGNH/GDSL hydrolase family protein [Lewinella sp. W8]MTB50837.1 SGNH/GDSL hydrolase family protein [Lewinella sp. W8]
MRFWQIPLLFLLVFTFACMKEEPTPTDVKTINYLALGDSYTIGTAVDPQDRWPVQLARELSQQPDLTVPEPDIVATNGWTTAELMAGIDAATLKSSYDLVSLLIGVNDQFRGLPIDGYRTRFTELLERAINFAGGDTSRVFVVSIPDYAFTPFGQTRPNVSTEVAAFNAAAKAITESYGIPFYNITPISQEGLDKPELVASDNLHPSGEQYTRWVEEVLKEPVLGLLQ